MSGSSDLFPKNGQTVWLDSLRLGYLQIQILELAPSLAQAQLIMEIYLLCKNKRN